MRPMADIPTEAPFHTAGTAGAFPALPAATVPARRTRSSRFSVLLESSVDYAAYRAAYGRQFLQQQPRFDSLRDAETELESVLHDAAFSTTTAAGDGSIMAENVALAVDWFISALVLLFDGDEPFQNPDFLRLCCMFFAAPLYENNARLVQRHLVKRAYAELHVQPGETAYEASLWLLLALLHLTTEFQPDTYLLCKDSGLFPLLQHLVVHGEERHLQVLAMSLMFEIAQAVRLSSTDMACVTDDTLLFLLEYIERMRYATSDVYNNTGTKLVLALNEQFLRISGYASMPQSPAAGRRDSRAARQMRQHRALVDKLERSGALAPHAALPPPADAEPPLSPPVSAVRAMHVRTASAGLSPPEATGLARSELLRHPAVHALPLESHGIPRSRSMDFRAQALGPGALLRSASESYDGDEPPNGGSGGGGGNPAHPANRSVSMSSSPLEPPSAACTPVVAILARRSDCCKTFTENLVFLLNRETDPTTQVLILHMLHSILSDAGTLGIMYTNDMHVLVDIMLRDLGNLAEGAQRVCQAYVLVLCALLQNPEYLAARHRLSDIELCLVSLLRQSLVCAQPVGSPRGSVGSGASTRHNSVASEGPRVQRGSGAASPAGSRGSAASEETCCLRPADEPPKSQRRPPPPPPSTSTLSRATPTGTAEPGRPAHRRRPPPPPPPSTQRRPATASAHLHPHSASASAMSSADDSSSSGIPRPHRRKAPPPPPPASRSRTPSTSRPHTPHCGPAPPPPPPPAVHRLPQADKPGRAGEQTGMRRQLSVKKSVGRYKRDGFRISPPPVPPPRSRGAGQECRPLVSPVIEAAAEREDEEEDEDEASLPLHFQDSAEGRRATRRLVESALRCCHEARNLAAMRSPTAGVF